MPSYGSIKQVALLAWNKVLLNSEVFLKIDLTKYVMFGILFVIILVHFSIGAQDKPKLMIFSYVNHPVIKNDIIPIVKRAYLKLGIQIELVEHPSYRNLKAVESGEVDGDIAYSDLLLKGYDNLVKIEPPFASSVFVLLCAPDVPCNQDVLFDNNNAIVSTDISFKGLQDVYDTPLSEGFYSINNLSVIPDLLAQKRFQYGIYVLAESQDLSAEFQNLKMITLLKTQTHHTINKKYAFMKEQINEALQLSLDEAKK
jgi:hypothetical protein